MNEIPAYTLSDCGEDVCVKPCRRCGHVPVFYWYDADGDNRSANIYVIQCPNCGMRKEREWSPSKVEAAWNDWSGSMEEWEGTIFE